MVSPDLSPVPHPVAQGLLGIQDLGQVFFEPIKDKQGNILIVTLKEVKTNQTFESVRWVPICKLQTSRKSVSSPEEPTALDTLLISVQVLSEGAGDTGAASSRHAGAVPHASSTRHEGWRAPCCEGWLTPAVPVSSGQAGLPPAEQPCPFPGPLPGLPEALQRRGPDPGAGARAAPQHLVPREDPLQPQHLQVGLRGASGLFLCLVQHKSTRGHCLLCVDSRKQCSSTAQPCPCQALPRAGESRGPPAATTTPTSPWWKS